MLTYVTTYYNNPTMLRLQYLNWSHWPDYLRERAKVIVVDDGSQEPAHEVQRPGGMPKLEIYRVLKDMPWHQDGARNLGCDRADNGWMLITDIDHMLEPKAAHTLTTLLHGESCKLKANRAYMPGRIEVTDRSAMRDKNGKLKPHPNSYVLQRNAYWEAGGFDERYCGIYGTDGKFKYDMAQAGITIHQLPQVPLTRYSREFVPDASCYLERTGMKNGAKKSKLDERPQDAKVLAFEWERMA